MFCLFGHYQEFNFQFYLSGCKGIVDTKTTDTPERISRQNPSKSHFIWQWMGKITSLDEIKTLRTRCVWVIQSGAKRTHVFQILPIFKTCVLITTHFKNMRSFYRPFKKCVLFTTHLKNTLPFYCPFKKHAFFLLPISKTCVLFTAHF
jgi:hypothetical protein